MSSGTYASLRCWLRCVQGRLLGDNVHDGPAASLHITGTGAITEQHVAFRHLQAMRERNVGQKVIDENGDFVDPESLKRPHHAGFGNGAAADAPGLTSLLECSPQLFPWFTIWEEEFLEIEYRMDVLPKWLLFATLVILLSVYDYIYGETDERLEDCWHMDVWYIKGRLFRALSQIPSIIVGVGTLLLYCAIKMGWIPYEQQWRRYPTIVLVWIASVCFAITFSFSVREMTRGLTGGVASLRPAGKCARTGHVRVTFSYSSPLNSSTVALPSRTCVDQDQLKTVREWPFLNTLGCETLLLDCTFSRQLEFMFILYFCRCSWRTALKCFIITNLTLILSCCAVGTYGWHVICHCLLHLGVGCVIAYLCHVNTQESRNKFAKVKHVKMAAKQRRSVLHTLIPPNVLARLSTHSINTGCLATDIPQCTIMFCSLSSRQEQAKSKRDSDTETEHFRRLHAVCLDFDDAVRVSGLYKYQHVGAWYIVTCPKAAAPFDVATDSSSSSKTPRQRFHASYATQMAQLALKLMSVARLHGFELQVGMHTGPAAGAVIGSLRAFYCIYGPAVNTASRLCKYGKPGQICCSQGLVTALESEYSASEYSARKNCAGHARNMRHRVRVDACGSVSMKGLESMDVFLIPVGSVFPKRSSDLDQPTSVNTDSFNVDAFSLLPAIIRKNSHDSTRRDSEDKSIMDVMDSDSHKDPFMALLQYQNLNPESRLFQNLAFFKAKPLSFFDEMGIHDEEYKQDIAQHLQRRVGAGILVHLFGVIFQRNLILYPEYPYNFEVLNATLKDSYASMSALLEQHLYFQCLICFGLVMVIMKNPKNPIASEMVSMLHGLLRLSWLPFSLHLSTIWPVKQYTVVFPAMYSVLQFLIIQEHNIIHICILVLHFAMYIMMFYPIRDIVPFDFIIQFLVTTLSTVMLHVWHDNASQQRWRLHRVFQYEMRLFEYILNDLLPSTFDQSALSSADDTYIRKLKANLAYDNYLRDNSLPLHHERDAIVLQLDLCSFTEFSRKISPMELAQTLHQLFSRFDATVRSLNLFKMDTVGDAYIVAAWLTPHEADSTRQNTEYMPHARKSCHSVLWLAGMMLNTLDSYRTKDGHQITARIGVAVGTVVVGSLGSMQPRIHIRGYGMRKAEELEQQGTPGMVNVCDKFLNILSGAHIPANNSTSRDFFMEDPPQHARFGEGTRNRRTEGSKSNMQDMNGPDLDLQGWSIVETRNSQPPDCDEATLRHNVSGLVGTSFILARPNLRDWESNREVGW